MKFFVTRIVSAVLHDHLLMALAGVAIVMSLWLKPSLVSLGNAIDWPTITTLSGLLILARGLESSGLLNQLAVSLIRYLHRERSLGIFLVVAAAVLSMLLTNDIALFVVVPLTLSLRLLAVLPISRLIIFEALAVNAGSMLSPIGNPQNILLWQQSGLSFIGFVSQMLPLTGVIFIALLALTALCFPSKQIELNTEKQARQADRSLAQLCAGLFVLFVTAVEYKYSALGLVVVLIVLLWRARKLIVQADWLLIIVFMLMFVDIHLLGQLPSLHESLSAWVHGAAMPQLWLSAILSQFISNVPATILLLQYTPANQAIAYGVNVGGFGLALGSMANLIALRMSGDKTIWWSFHAYSFPALVFSLGVAALML